MLVANGRIKRQIRAPIVGLTNVPELAAAMRSEGWPRYEDAFPVVRSRSRVEGAGAAMVKLTARDPRRVLRAWFLLSRLGREARDSRRVLRYAWGPASATEVYALAIFGRPEAYGEFLALPEAKQLLSRRPGSSWVMRWTADHEFGQWDSLRVRRIMPSLRRSANGGPP
jgi:hypothetical protein